MQDFRKLDIYNRAIRYCADVYEYAVELPNDERYGLVSQIKRAACSIPLNISEGAGAGTNKEFAQFMSYAYRSVNEVLTCLELIDCLKLNSNQAALAKLRKEAIELSRMIFSFHKKINSKSISFPNLSLKT